ncbi:MAG: hypothetical protein QOD81_3993 [Solirubrobacteraceae bacterium]|nr:hypothetical protein [Solirubrobacteraceae bacterium]
MPRLRSASLAPDGRAMAAGGGVRPSGARRRVRASPEQWLTLLPIAFLALFFLYPFGDMVWASVSRDGLFAAYAEALDDPFFVRAVVRTLVVSLVCTVACLVLGYAIAYELTRRRTPIRTVILGVVLLTFWISILIRAYSWLAILQPGGVLSDVAGLVGISAESWRLQGTTTAVAIGMVHFLLPYMVLVLIPPLRAVDPALLRAAHSLGASRLRTFWRVTLPLTKGGIVAGCILTFILSIGFYVMPSILGGPANPFVANVIGEQVGTFQAFPVAGAMSVLLTVVVLCLYATLVRVSDPTKILGDSGKA